MEMIAPVADDPLIPWPDTKMDLRALQKSLALVELAIHKQVMAAKGYPDTWDSDELNQVYKVENFAAYLCFVTRKSDGVRGTLDFTQEHPRLYFDFVPRT